MDADSRRPDLGWRGDELVVQSSDMALMNVASLANSGSLDLSPRFQRRDRWARGRQSALIESFLMNVPVPPVYLAEEARGIFAVIDGKQRLTAITQFLNDEFALQELSFRREFSGARFSELNAHEANTLAMRPIRAVMVMRQSADWVKHEVFLRLNTGGQALNAQEVRNVAYAGPLNDRIISLAEHPFLRQQMKIRDASSAAYVQMADVETVLRFLAVSETWRSFGGGFADSLNTFMLENKDEGPSRIERLSDRFLRAVDWCATLWDDVAFRRFDGSIWRDQFLGAVYDAQMVAVNEMPDDALRRIGPDVARERMARMFADASFEEAVRVSTNTPARVRRRIGGVVEMLHELS